MGIGVSGIYQLRFKLGNVDLPLSPSTIGRMEITEYLDRFLPTIYAEFRDTTGFFTHVTQMDSRYNVMTVSFSNDNVPDSQKDIRFKVFRGKPESVVQATNNVLLSGMLDIENLFSPNFERGWEQSTVSDIISILAKEMTFSQTQINPGLTSQVSLVQPNWTNAQFLNYLCDNVKSDNNDFGFLAYVDIPSFLQTRLNFMSITSLLTQKSVQTYINVAEVTDPNDLPIHSYNIITNYDLIAHMGVEQQVYGYFDYITGTYINRTIALEDADFTSLSSYYAYDNQDGISGMSQNLIGITNNLVSDYESTARGNYYKKINSLVKMWIHSEGTNRINPGNIVKVIFPQTSQGDSIFSYQYSGYWLVEQIKHRFGSVYTTSLLLTRPGFDTDKDTTFVRAKNVKK